MTLFKSKKFLITLYLLAVLLFIGIGLEIFAGYYLLDKQSFEYKTIERRVTLPYLLFGDYGQKLDFSREFQTVNEVGFHAPAQYSIKKPANTFRIFFFGGSTAGYGGRIRMSKRYYTVLENMLNERFTHTNFECISGGMNSYVSNQELVWFEFSGILNMEPDLVVMFNGYNDIYHPLWYSDIGYPFIYRHREHMFWSPLYYTLGKLSNHSALVKFLFNSHVVSEAQQKRKQLINDPQTPQRMAGNYVNNMEKVAALLSVYSPHTKMIVALQPFLPLKKHLTDNEQSILARDYETQEFIKNVYPVFSQALLNSPLLKQKNVMIEDITNVFDEETTDIYSDPCHFLENGPGSALIANKFFGVVETLVETPND